MIILAEDKLSNGNKNKSNNFIKKGDIINIKLEDLAYGGDCVGHHKGLAVFVNSGVPGERVRVKITQKKKSYARGRIKKVIYSSSRRIEPGCDVYDQCGGCQIQEINYPYQLKLKKDIVGDALERIGDLEQVTINEVIGADYPWYYRNKAQFPLTEDRDGKIKSGFFGRGSHQVVTNEYCPIHHQLINRTAEKTIDILNQYQDLSVYDEKKHEGLLRHLLVRAGVCTNQATLTFVTSREKFPHLEEISELILNEVPELVGVIQNINDRRTNVILGDRMKLIAGKEKLTDYIGKLKFNISPEAFFQTNTLQTRKLYDIVVDYADLEKDEKVFDCYCGIGSIALYLAGQADKVYGIEINQKSVENARKNAKINKINNAKFYQGDVTNKIEELLHNNIKPDLVIFDPPRKGLKKEIIKTMLDITPEKIIYVSCNPSTLARDLKLFSTKYNVERVQPVDMFPQTFHIESVTLLKRKER
jgi:23S rRNA (uracil1939-C5)-methyltransferase